MFRLIKGLARSAKSRHDLCTLCQAMTTQLTETAVESHWDFFVPGGKLLGREKRGMYCTRIPFSRMCP
jgi:hypothetical protein